MGCFQTFIGVAETGGKRTLPQLLWDRSICRQGPDRLSKLSSRVPGASCHGGKSSVVRLHLKRWNDPAAVPRRMAPCRAEDTHRGVIHIRDGALSRWAAAKSGPTSGALGCSPTTKSSPRPFRFNQEEGDCPAAAPEEREVVNHFRPLTGGRDGLRTFTEPAFIKIAQRDHRDAAPPPGGIPTSRGAAIGPPLIEPRQFPTGASP